MGIKVKRMRRVVVPRIRSPLIAASKASNIKCRAYFRQQALNGHRRNASCQSKSKHRVRSGVRNMLLIEAEKLYAYSRYIAPHRVQANEISIA